MFKKAVVLKKYISTQIKENDVKQRKDKPYGRRKPECNHQWNKNSNLEVTHHRNPLLILSNMHASPTAPLHVPFLKHTAHLLRQSMLPVIERPSEIGIGILAHSQ